jgi:uncharacterized protein (TIGR02145 family)
MSDGEKRTEINGTDAGDSYTVWYSSFSFPTLQSLSSSGTCAGTPIATVVYRDSRDSQLYYVAKLDDNKCWMLDNLRYKPNGDTAGTVTPAFSATQVASTGQYLTDNGTSSSAAPNFDVAKYIDPISSPGGSNLCRSNSSNSLVPAENITRCGLLYNWYTATAGTAPQSQTTGDTSGSICPANWHLPAGRNASGDFGVLDITYGGTGAYQIGTPAQLATLWLSSGAWHGVFSGYYASGFNDQGTNGIYWSSSVTSAANGYALNFGSTLVHPGTNGNDRYYGFAIRCVD